LARLATARTTSGIYSAANWVNDRHVRTQARRGRVLVAAMKLGGYVPREVAARLAVVPAELRAPVHPSQIPYLEIATKTLGSGGPDVPGRCAAGAFSAPRVRAAELAAARAEQAALAPWRAAVAAARLAKREALAARRAARMGKHDKDPMPMERLPGTGLGARAAGIAAATEAGGAGTAAGVASARQVSGPGDGRTVEVGRAAPVAKPHAPVGARPPRDAGLPEPHAPIPGLAVPATPPALPNRAARRRWKSLQRRKHRPFQHPSAPPVAARGWPDQPPGQAPGGKVYRP
jgi:hypothetical protein